MAELAQTDRGRRSPRGWLPTNSTSLLIAGSLGAAACLTAVALFQTTIGNSQVLESNLIDVAAPLDAIEADVPNLSDAAGAAGLATAPPTTVLASSAPAETVPLLVVSPIAAASAENHLARIAIGSKVVAGGILLDGYLITSASAVGNQLSVSYVHQDTTSIAYLVGIDPFSDLAVFRPSAESRAGRTLQALTIDFAEHPAVSVDDMIPVDETAPVGTGHGDDVILAAISDGGLESADGIVIAIDRDGVTPEGHPLIGLIDTNIRRPDYLGSLLLAPDGAVIGIVVNTSSSLVSAIPVRDAVAIADRLNQRGWANETWIGFVGIDQDDGVEVIDVTVDGPAAAAGLQPGDVIRFLDGAPIDHMGGVTAGLRRAAPGDTIIVIVTRADELLALRVEAKAYDRKAVSEPVGG